MKKSAFVLAAALAAALLAGCAAAPAMTASSTPMATGSSAPMAASSSASMAAGSSAPMTAAYHKITAEEAKKMMDAGGVTIVDVRTQEEYDAGHIENAVLVPNESITADAAPAALPDKKAVLLIYCRSGRRSKLAADKLTAQGYENVYDFGGINDWPYDVVK